MENQKKRASLQSPIFEALACSMERQYIFLCDVKGNCWRWSQEAVEAFALPGEYVEDFPSLWLERVHPSDRARVEKSFEGLISGCAEERPCEYRMRNRDGKYMWVQCRGQLVEGAAEAPLLCAGIVTDLGQRNKFDALTGLISASEFSATLANLLLRPEARGGLLLWGIDSFRRVNDVWGYSFGTALLGQYGQQLGERFPERLLYRLGGDQFAVICPDEGETAVAALFEEVSEIGKTGLCIDGQMQRFTISGGAVLYPAHGQREEVLYSRMEYALECAKKTNREQLTFFTTRLHDRALRDFELQQCLRKSVQNGCEGFTLCYQPIVSAEQHKLSGVEALLRWSGPGFPAVGPTEFIPILESFGDIHRVGKWVLSTALEQVRRWQERLPELRLSVNVSYLQMRDSSFKSFVLEQVERWEFPKELLVLELTESCNIVSPGELARDLRDFRKSGIQIALDDFGTGYASLSVLRDLGTDWIKIDQSFVAQVTENAFDKALTEYLIALCGKLGLRVCVEGIETEEIEQIIAGFSPDALQGYYYSHPLHAEEFETRFLNLDAP